jgi:putative tricarboxylic transport membrane protein
VITTFLILLAYVYLIDILGYLVITPLALGLLMWYFGERRWLLILFSVIITTTSLFFFFRYIMYIILPEGILFP